MGFADARIEPLTGNDVEALAALAREIWYAHYPAIISTAQIEYMLAQRYRPAIVRSELAAPGIWWDKLMIGTAMAGFSSYFLVPPGLEMKLDKLYVHPGRQRLGYGGLMIERACEAARTRDCRRLVLAVNKRNASAIAAYRKHGFGIADAITKDIGGGFVMDDYLMVKPLADG
jgi:ribosomal protein S18 acetylase RimI-like enzyme